MVSKVARARPLGQGFDADTGEYGDLAERGRHRPGQGDQGGAGNAASIAAMVLTTECAVVEKPDEQPQAGDYDGSAHGHSHGGHAGHSHGHHH